MFICTASIYFRKMLSSSSLICTWISDFILSMLFIYPNKPVETNKIKYMDHIVISYNMQDNIRDKIMLRFFLSATLFSGILCDYVFTEELFTLSEHLTSPPVLVGFVLFDLQFYVYILQIVVCPFVLFLLTIVLSVLYGI